MKRISSSSWVAPMCQPDLHPITGAPCSRGRSPGSPCPAAGRAPRNSLCRSWGRCSPLSSPRSQPRTPAPSRQAAAESSCHHDTVEAPAPSSPWSSPVALPGCPVKNKEKSSCCTRGEDEKPSPPEQQQQKYLRECFGQFEACKQLSVLRILGSDWDACQHEAGDQLQVDFDVEPGGEEAPAVGEGVLRHRKEQKTHHFSYPHCSTALTWITILPIKLLHNTINFEQTSSYRWH